MRKFVHAVDKFTTTVGPWCSLLMLPTVFVVVYEVTLRKVFHAPTSWGFEMTVYLYGAHFMLGMAYTFYRNMHVRIDIITMMLPKKVQLWIEILCFWIIFVPFIGALVFASINYAAASWGQWEHSWSAWKPPLYPYKTIMAISFVWLFIQGVAVHIRDLYKLAGKEL